MKILSCDTSTDILHLGFACLEEGKQPFYDLEVCTTARGHSEVLMPRILDLLGRNNLALKDLDLLVCTKGPGSFTGLRIAMSTLKGISLALGTPLVSVPSLKAIASCNSTYPHEVLAVIDAKKKRFYAALFKGGKRLSEDLDIDADGIQAMLENLVDPLLCGSDAPLLASKLSVPCRVNADSHQLLPLMLCRLGKARFEEQGSDSPDDGPVYIRKSDAEIALQETLKSLEESHD